MTAASLPKPRITPTSTTSWIIDFGNGATGSITRLAEFPRTQWDWTVDWTVTTADGVTIDGRSGTDRLALECMWCRAAQASAPASLVINDIEVARMSREVKTGNAVETAKVLRRLLRARAGFAWSVRVSRGSARVHISSTPKRRVNGRMSAHDTALLASVLGEAHVSDSGFTVGVEAGDRVSALRAIIGPQQAMAVAL